jgi:carboxymethylenebutenolidase
MPEEAIRDFERALAEWGGKYKSETYEGAHHGWTASDNPAYNQTQAERAFQELLGLFAQITR